LLSRRWHRLSACNRRGTAPSSAYRHVGPGCQHAIGGALPRRRHIRHVGVDPSP
jgi:hypothetical protein